MPYPLDASAWLVVIALFLSLLCGCSRQAVHEAPAEDGAGAINYEDLATDIDQGHIAAYDDKRLRVRGYIRSYLDLPSGAAIAFGEQLPGGRFPTILCVLSASDLKGNQFRGDEVTGGIYHSAFPDRLVTIDMLFTGRISGQDVYGGKACTVE